MSPVASVRCGIDCRLRAVVLAAAVAGGLLLAASSPTAARAADWLLVNGRIATLDAQSRVVEAMAITGDRIVATGTAADLRPHANAATRTIDLGGRTVIPGLVDSHIHAIRAGHRFAVEVSWIGATSLAEALSRLRSGAASSPAGSWIVVAGGWTPAQFAERRRPSEAEIIAAAPGRRVYVQLFYRAALLSPEGRQALGLVDDGDLPAGAKLERDANGRPDGWIAGSSPAITGLFARLPAPSLDDSLAGTRRFLAELNRFGITGIIDPGGHNLAPEDYEAVMRLAQAGGLTVRVAYSLSAPRPGSELADLQALTRLLPMGSGHDLLRFNGIGERVTWGLYNNDNPSAAQQEEFFRVARWAAERGLALTAHWNNDRSVHHLLDVLERVDREVPLRALRWSIAHLHDASDASLTRMKAMGIGWLMQNGLHFAAPAFIASRGSAMDRSPPIKSAMRSGVRIGGGTDANRVMSYNPFVSLKWMTDGRTVDGLPTRASGELISREEALRLYTGGSAWFAFDDHARGSLEPGRLADIAVLDRDYFTVPAAELGGVQAVLTMVGGRIVHGAGPFAAFKPGQPD